MDQDKSFEHLVYILNEWITQKKIGSIQVNFFKGGVPNIIKNESKKLDKNFKNPKNEVDYESGKVKNLRNYAVNNS